METIVTNENVYTADAKDTADVDTAVTANGNDALDAVDVCSVIGPASGYKYVDTAGENENIDTAGGNCGLDTAGLRLRKRGADSSKYGAGCCIDKNN